MSFVELAHPLMPQGNTKVLFKTPFRFNAPHDFMVIKDDTSKEPVCHIHFQEGPVKENGINGVSNEDLIAMVIKRLKCFQDSDYYCAENQNTIGYLEDALIEMGKRTKKRIKRGVEGTSKT